MGVTSVKSGLLGRALVDVEDALWMLNFGWSFSLVSSLVFSIILLA